MRPRPLRVSSGAARCAQKNCAFRFESSRASHCASRGFGERRGRKHAGVVDEDVEAAEVALGFVEEALDLIEARQVGAQAKRFAAGAGQSRRRRRWPRASECAVMHDDSRAFGGQAAARWRGRCAAPRR